MQANATGIISLPVSGALLRYRRVILSAGVLAYAGANDRALGVTAGNTPASGLGASTVAAVVSSAAPGTRYIEAGAAIAQYAPVYGAASGKIDDVPNGNLVGIALQAATADGDVIEVLPLGQGGSGSVVEAKTADYTVLAADNGKTFTTVGAAGTVVFAMPAAVVGMKYRFRVGAAQELRIDPNGTEVIALPSTGVAGAAGKYLTANADGETVELECTKAGQWSVFGFTGTWTAEA